MAERETYIKIKNGDVLVEETETPFGKRSGFIKVRGVGKDAVHPNNGALGISYVDQLGENNVPSSGGIYTTAAHMSNDGSVVIPEELETQGGYDWKRKTRLRIPEKGEVPEDIKWSYQHTNINRLHG